MELNGGFKKLARREPRWLTSFADLMSLLFALFVLLLSFSEVDSDSFKKNAGPISQAFHAKQNAKIDVPPTPTASPMPSGNSILEFFRPPETLADEEVEEAAERARVTKELVSDLRRILANELEDQLVDVLETDNRVTVRFRDRAMFPIGERELSEGIMPTLDSIATVLAKTPGRIRIEGHTDDVPITTSMYRSNWDLSAARATSVVHHLLQTGLIDARRLSAEGFADSRPLAENTTPEGRSMNRRVEILIDLQTTGAASPWGKSE